MERQTYFEEIDRAYGSLTGPALENRIRELVEEGRREYGGEDPFYAAMLSELGGYYRGQRRLEESERCFEEAVSILRQAVGEGDLNYATAVNNLAGTHRLMGRYDEAEREFLECLKLYREKLGEEHIFYASGLNNLSLLCLERGDLKRAAALLGEAADILDKQPECLDELATSLCNLGELERRLGHTQAAREKLHRAVELYETKLGTMTPHYHAALNTLGLTYCRENRWEEACLWLERGVAAAEKLYGPEHPETVAGAEHLRLAREQAEGRS